MTDIKPTKLWNKNFLLLWQGSLVSFVGDMIYQFALGFWVLNKTGSTAIMGTVMAAGLIPQVVIGVFAGTYVDRHDRKKIIVVTDVIRGIVVLLAGILALLDLLPIWGVIVVSLVIGTCSSFFYPASGSALPDIVPIESLDKANSLSSMIHSGGRIVGKGLAGVLFAIVGAPVLFIANGISYLLSAFSESFVSIPHVHKENIKKSFRDDLKSGGLFLWNNKGLRTFVLLAAFLNFTAVMGEVLLLPYFNEQPWLGPERFGLFEAISAAGALAAMSILAVYTIPTAKRAMIFIWFLIFQGLFMCVVPLFSSFALMLIFIFLSLFANSIVNVLL